MKTTRAMKAKARMKRGGGDASGGAGRLILAIDVGGTKVEAALIDARGKVVGTERRPMVVDGSAADGLRSVREAVDAVLAHAPKRSVKAIGVSVPGWVDAEKGKVLQTANLPCWHNYPLAAKLRQIYGIPVRLENDANTAAAAEALWGAGRGYRRFFYVSLGTGIGTCMAYRTKNEWQFPASEGGHTTINFSGPLCPCGRRGCIEMYASGKAIAREAKQRVASGDAKVSLLKEMAHGNWELLKTEMVVGAAKQGDALSQEILNDACDRLAVWLGNILDILDPEAIVFGGGLAGLFMQHQERIQKTLQESAIRPNAGKIKIVKARFGAQSALMGAAALWLQTP
jgi:glucokinase